MRILITGASGLLGLNLAMDASRANEVIGVDRNTLASAPFRVVQADLLEEESFNRVVKEVRPEAVIHCAALADLEACEAKPDYALRMNAGIARRVAEVCARRRIRLIHISTDAVFSGRKEGAYVETDVPDPRGVYAITKLEGERSVLEVYPDATIARINFYGWSINGKRSLAEFFVNHLSAGSNVNGFTDVRFCPLFVGHLDVVLLRMLARNMPGLYHVVGPQAMTKYQFGIEIAHKFGLKASLISPQSVERAGLQATRAHNLWLSTHKVSTELGLEFPDFSTGLSAFHAQYQQGYPQKLRSFQQPARAGVSG